MKYWLMCTVAGLLALGAPARADVVGEEEKTGREGINIGPIRAGQLEVTPIMSVRFSGSSLFYRAGVQVAYSISRWHQIGGSFIVYIPQYARILRAAVLKVRELDYVVSAKVIGASDSRILLTTVLPNCIAPLIVQATLGIGAAILDAAGLSFLGLGAEIGEPEWGAMLNENRKFIRRAPLTVTAPGIAIFLIVLGFNLLGDALRDALDPQID